MTGRQTVAQPKGPPTTAPVRSRTAAPRRIQGLDRGLVALETLASTPEGLSLGEISRRLAVDKSTTHRLMGTLMARGFARLDGNTQRYRLGLRLVGLGATAWQSVDLPQMARPHLEALRDSTSEAAHLAVLSEGEVLFLGKASAPSALTVNVGIGARAPLHCTSLGKALLAWLEPAELDVLLTGRHFHSYTTRTITDSMELKRHLEVVRGRGWAFDDEERDVGLRCLAAPARDAAGRVVAAIGISGPAARITLHDVERIASEVVARADLLAAALGYRAAGGAAGVADAAITPAIAPKTPGETVEP